MTSFMFVVNYSNEGGRRWMGRMRRRDERNLKIFFAMQPMNEFFAPFSLDIHMCIKCLGLWAQTAFFFFFFVFINKLKLHVVYVNKMSRRR